MKYRHATETKISGFEDCHRAWTRHEESAFVIPGVPSRCDRHLFFPRLFWFESPSLVVSHVTPAGSRLIASSFWSRVITEHVWVMFTRKWKGWIVCKALLLDVSCYFGKLLWNVDFCNEKKLVITPPKTFKYYKKVRLDEAHTEHNRVRKGAEKS